MMEKSPEIHTPFYGRMSIELVKISNNGGYYWLVDERISDTDGIFAESVTFSTAGDAWRAMMNNKIKWESTYSEISGIKNLKKTNKGVEEAWIT